MRHPPFLVRLRLAAVVFVSGTIAAGAVWSAAAADEPPDEQRLVRALQVQPGMTLAEIGAGDGELTLALARRVTGTGRLYTTELGADRVRTLRTAVERAKLPQVTVLEADAARTNLPDGCCDAIFMRAVYHHFNDPPAMNASLKASLKPGGLLAVLDFAPPSPKSARPGERGRDGQHGVTRETAVEELTAAGFEIVSTEDRPSRGFMVVARRPE